jgi:hypothetical protein
MGKGRLWRSGVNLIEKLEVRNGAMKVAELCELLGVDA